MTRILLIRHGESTWNLIGRYQGRIDTELSELGIKQAELIAEHIKKNFRLSAIYSSPLRRALHTAIIIATRLGLGVEVREGLTEIDHVAWNGLLRSEVEKRYGPILEEWLTHPGRVRMPGGEGLFDVLERSWAVIEEILEKHRGEDVGVCSHNAVLKVLILKALSLPLDNFWKIGIDNASISVLEFDGKPKLLYLNDTCFIGPYRSESEGEAL